MSWCIFPNPCGELGAVIEGFERCKVFSMWVLWKSSRNIYWLLCVHWHTEKQNPVSQIPKTQEQQIHRQILYTNPTLQDWTELSNPTRIADAFVKFPDTTYAILKWLGFQELRIATYIPIWKTYWISKMSVLNIGHINNLPHYMPRICVANCSCDG